LNNNLIKEEKIMKNKNNCGCGCEDIECVDESINDNSNDKNEVKKQCNAEKTVPSVEEECGCGSEDSPTEVDDYSPCCSGDSVKKEGEEEEEEDSGCGCGCGNKEYPDISQINNPETPKFMADDDFINEFENYAHSIGIKGVGYTQITPELLIKDTFIPYPHTIVLTMEMGREIIENPPGAETQQLNDAAYAKLGKMTYHLSDYLRDNGFATQVAHPEESKVNFTPLAQKASLGRIGKSGLLISPEVGSGQKISAIFVSIANLPEKNPEIHSWISEYCKRCSNCIKACPEKALLEKEGCCGNKETEFVQKLCIGCIQGCTYCIEECPFHTKGYEHVKMKFDKMTAKLMEKGNKGTKNKCC
jgi:epoxyqueuosine reductase QueG